MKKSILSVIIATSGFFSCMQSVKSTPENVRIATINSERKYEYTDSKSKHVTIKNGLPKGTTYIGPDGKEYFKVIFWTQIFNETDNPLKLKISFPVDRYEVPQLPGYYYKILLPSDTMTTAKARLYDYGMTRLKTFLDNNIDKPTSIERTITQKESTGFFVVLLSLKTDITPGTPIRTGFILKNQKLFYKISRYASKEGNPLISEVEIPCGSINLKNLVLTR